MPDLPSGTSCDGDRRHPVWPHVCYALLLHARAASPNRRRNGRGAGHRASLPPCAGLMIAAQV
jgi:hypothetical protein